MEFLVILFVMTPYYDAVISWMKKRHNWQIEKEWIVYCPGVVPALNMLIQALTGPGDKVLIQQPVYYYFMKSIINNKRKIINNELILHHNLYQINFEDLEKKAADPKCKLMFLCSPHNPVGRIWSKVDLEKIVKICEKNQITLISDEIHHDLILQNKHYPIAALSEWASENTITCTAPSKTFNLAGLQVSNIIVKNPLLKRKVLKTLQANGILGPNAFAHSALVAAYNDCENWLDHLLLYIKSNYHYLKSYLNEKLPAVTVHDLEATYLVWIDFEKISDNEDAINQLLIEKARIGLDKGSLFGEKYKTFQRINIACPRSTLEQALLQITGSFKN
jgi:cysteine-S-conjugate beta-lyase